MSLIPKFPKFSHARILLLLLVLLLVVLIFPNILSMLAYKVPLLDILSELNPRYLEILLIIFIFGFFLLQFRRTNKRLNLLAKVADKVGQGNYDTQSDDTGTDSIGRLAGTINLMARKIGAAVLELEESQNDLEVSRVQL